MMGFAWGLYPWGAHEQVGAQGQQGLVARSCWKSILKGGKNSWKMKLLLYSILNSSLEASFQVGKSLLMPSSIPSHPYSSVPAPVLIPCSLMTSAT